MIQPVPVEPVEARLAERLRARYGDDRFSSVVEVLHRLDRADREVYRAVAELRTPWLDGPLRLVSRFANFSKPWLLAAAALGALGGSQGRRAAVTGIAAIGVTSFVVNQPMKAAGERRRPHRSGLGVPEERWVRMPTSASFPSGHSASAAAFSVAVGAMVPGLRWPLRAAASAVAFSRVYTGVHYPGDVIVGVAVGGLCGRVASTVAERVHRP